MSALVAELSDLAATAAVELCWREWRSLMGANLRGTATEADGVLDPEALVLLSLAVRDRERRLDDCLAWWAGVGSALTSLQRMRTLAKDFSPRVREELGAFAVSVVQRGDARWKVLAGRGREGIGGRPGKGPERLELRGALATMLRLRAGLGVGAKADLLAYLVAAQPVRGSGPRATVAELSELVGYSVPSLRRAAGDMVLGGLLVVEDERPVSYAVDVEAWLRVLAGGGAAGAVRERVVARPKWRFPAQVAGFLAEMVACGEDARLVAAGAVVQESRLRDVVERRRRFLRWVGVRADGAEEVVRAVVGFARTDREPRSR